MFACRSSLRFWSSSCRKIHVVGRKPSPGQASAFSTKTPVEIVSIPCQSNGSITVEIYHPENVPVLQSRRPAVVLYLPRGPVLANSAHDASNVSILNTTLPCPIVKINYRWDEHYRFPTSIHDTIAAFDWVRQNLLPKRSITRAGRSQHIGSMIACGELCGGQLATVLALTECRAREPGITAAAISNPLVDWVTVHRQGAEMKLGQDNFENMQLPPVELATIRNQIFRKPEDYFDPFASPILFFRTAGEAIPAKPVGSAPLDDMTELALSERERLYGESVSEDNHDTDTDADESRKLRKASRRFPSKALGLDLPAFHIAAGSHSPTLSQAIELTRCLRQSFERQSKAGLRSAMADSENAMVGRPVHFAESFGLGLWDDSEVGRTRMLDTARWIASNLQ